MSAAAITLGFMVAEYLPGRFASTYAETLGPLLGTSWLSYVLHKWWREHEALVLQLSTWRLWAILAAALFLLLPGGFRLLWADFWLFAPMLWPLIEIALTLRRRSRRGMAGAA